MRTILVCTTILAAALLLMKPLFNVSPGQLGSSMEVANGLGAKLACSGRYVTGLDARAIAADIATYSPALGLLDISYDETRTGTRATLGGLGEARASYREGLGCTLDLPGAGQLDSVRVSTVEPRQAPWPLGDVVETIAPGHQQAAETLLAEDNAEGYQTRALLMVRNGVITAEAHAPGFDATTMHLGWSMGKSVTALLLGLLEYDGLVDPAESGLFPDWSGGERAAITLENLLQMSSGLAFEEDYTPGTDATRMLFAAPSAAAVAMAQPLEHAPGSHFSYSSGTTNLLTLLYHQRVGGSTQAAVDYLRQRLFVPLGMSRSLIEPDPSGVFVGSSYIYASGQDWARMGQLMLNEGAFEGRQLLDPGWVRRARSPNGSQNDPRYGYQFWLNSGGGELRWPELPADAYAMQGNRGQVVMIIPSLDTVIVRLGWSAQEYPRSKKFAGLLGSRLR